MGCMKWIHWVRGRNCWSTGNKVSGLRNPMAGIQEMNGWGTGIKGLGSLRSMVAAHKNNRCVVRQIYGWGPGHHGLGLLKLMARIQENQWLGSRKSMAVPLEYKGSAPGK